MFCFLFAASDTPGKRNLHVRLQKPRKHIAVGQVGAVGNQKGMAGSLGKRLHGDYERFIMRLQSH